VIQFSKAQPLIEALEGNEFAFVPTMGNLHLGHLSLIRTAKGLDIPVVCSILVNKLQFGANEDFDSYPRTLSADLDALKELGCDYVFTPNNDLYHDIDELKCAPELSQILCGKSRPIFFDGIITILNWFFNTLKPHHVFMGEKDFQQLFIVKNFVTKHHPDITIHGVPTVREPSGLAMSSRNNLLSEDLRSHAAKFYQMLKESVDLFPDIPISQIQKQFKSMILVAGFEYDYFEIFDKLDITNCNPTSKPIVAASAVTLEGVRLIDNIIVDF
jgi:pantoate--beta-alanine ligase